MTDADSSEANPHFRPAKTALYIIWAFGAALILGVLYVSPRLEKEAESQ